MSKSAWWASAIPVVAFTASGAIACSDPTALVRPEDQTEEEVCVLVAMDTIALGETKSGYLRGRHECVALPSVHAFILDSATAVRAEITDMVFYPWLGVGTTFVRNATSVVYLPAGTHRVTVRSWDPYPERRNHTPGSIYIPPTALTGPYRVTLRAWPLCQATAVPIAIGETRTGSLSDMTQCVRDGSPDLAIGFGLTLDAPSAVRIEFETSAFGGSQLAISDASGQVVYDAGPGLTNRRYIDLEAGEYTLSLSPFAEGDEGTYSLDVFEAPPPCAAASVSAAIAAEQNVSGSLDTTDCAFPGRGTYADGYIVTMGAADLLMLEVTGNDFDPWILLTDLNMKVISGPGTLSDDGRTVSTYAEKQSDTIIAWVTSPYQAQEATGTYRLTVRRP